MANSSSRPAPVVRRRPSARVDAWFEITKRGSSLGREVRGGLVTFFTMAYIIALNPLIIGTATDKNGLLISGLPKIGLNGEVIVANVSTSIAMVGAATALIAGVMTILMGVFGRFPMGIATGLGLNAVLAHVIAPQMTWPQAMGLVVLEGFLITLLVITGFREAVFRAVPRSLRTGISVGIGLFIAFIGVMDAGVVRKPAGSTPVELGINGALIGWPIALFLATFMLLVVMFTRRVKGALLISIAVATTAAMVIESVLKLGAHIGDKNPMGWALNVPALPSAAAFAAPNLGLLGRVDVVGAFFPNGTFNWTTAFEVLLLVFALMFADFFDTMGTVVAVAAQGRLLDARGNPAHMRDILLVDSLAAMVGGLGSVSSNTSYIESAAGVGEGARTGLASVVTGTAFVFSLFLAPLVNMVPAEAVAPSMLFVGFLMMSQAPSVNWDDPEDGLPAFLTMVLMPFTYSITVGIGAGFTSYVLIKLARGRIRQVHPLLILIAALFLIYFGQGALTSLLNG